MKFRAAAILRLMVLAILMGWAGRGVLSYYAYTAKLWNPDMLNKDAAATWGDRLRGIRDDIPPRGVIGYLSEDNYPGLPFSPTDMDEEFALTQYTLAPLILDRGSAGHRQIIGNFAGEFPYQFERDLGVLMVTNYGYGIYLLSGRAP